MEHWSGGPSERRPSRRASARDRGYARLLAMRQPRTCIPTVEISPHWEPGTVRVQAYIHATATTLQRCTEVRLRAVPTLTIYTHITHMSRCPLKRSNLMYQEEKA